MKFLSEKKNDGKLYHVREPMETSPDTRLQSESKVLIYSFETISIKKYQGLSIPQ